MVEVHFLSHKSQEKSSVVKRVKNLVNKSRTDVNKWLSYVILFSETMVYAFSIELIGKEILL